MPSIVTVPEKQQASVAEVEDRWDLGPANSVLLEMIGFEPTGPEQADILRCRKRLKLVVGGGQAGKSLLSSADFILKLFEDRNKRPGESLLYWLLAADYDRTRAEFGYIAEFLSRIAEKTGLKIDQSKVVNPGWIELYSGKKVLVRIETKSGKDPRTLAMYAPHGIIGCEASQLDLDTYYKCLERITARSGWLLLAGTYESSLGWYPGLAAAWSHGGEDEQSFRLPTPSNKALFPEGEDDPKFQRLKSEASDAYYMERIMGVAAPPRGLVFDMFRPDVHIRPVTYDPDRPIFIWTDPGYGHAYAIEIAQVAPGGQIHIVDEIYERGIVVQDLIEIAMKRPWWKNRSKKLVIDPHFANQHQGQASQADIWLEKTGLTPFGRKVKISDGVDRLKGYMKVDALSGKPGILFNPACTGVLGELGAYPNKFDGQTHVYSWKMDSEGNILGDEPEQKWNDGVSAIIYGVVEEFGLINELDNGHFTVIRRTQEILNRSPRTARRRRSVFA
jgi:hypothetical protein